MDFHNFPMILGNLGVEGDHPPKICAGLVPAADSAGAGYAGEKLRSGAVSKVTSPSGPGRFAVLRPLFSASGVGVGVGPCVFGRGLALLPSLALFGGLHPDLGLCCAWSGKNADLQSTHIGKAILYVSCGPLIRSIS